MNESANDQARVLAATRAALDAVQSSAVALDATLDLLRAEVSSGSCSVDTVAEALGLSRSAARDFLDASNDSVLVAIGGRSLRALQFVCALCSDLPKSYPASGFAFEALGISDVAVHTDSELTIDMKSEWEQMALEVGVVIHWSNSVEPEES